MLNNEKGGIFIITLLLLFMITLLISQILLFTRLDILSNERIIAGIVSKNTCISNINKALSKINIDQNYQGGSFIENNTTVNIFFEFSSDGDEGTLIVNTATPFKGDRFVKFSGRVNLIYVNENYIIEDWLIN